MNLLIVALLSAYITYFFTNRKERNILIEKWMNQLRDEVSKYLGLCEQLRLLKKVEFANPIYGDLVTSMYKIELLLNKDDKKDGNIQNKLLEGIIKLRELADLKDFTSFELLERKVIDDTYCILDANWKEISSELKNSVNYQIKQLIEFFRR